MHTLTYRYTRPSLRRYYLRELWRHQSGFLISVPLLVAIATWASLNAGYGWFAGFLIGLSVGYAIMISNGLRQLNEYMVDEPVTATVSEAGLHFDSSWAVSDIPWHAIRSARATPDGLILTVRVAARPVLFPAYALSPQIVDFVMRMVKQGRDQRNDGA